MMVDKRNYLQEPNNPFEMIVDDQTVAKNIASSL